MQAALRIPGALTSSGRGVPAQGNAQHCSSFTSRRHFSLQRYGRGLVAAATGADGSSGGHPVPPPLSLFLPYKALPPDGQVIPPDEESCDIEVRRCKTLAYVYETPCTACSGTGHARSASSRGGGRGGGRRGSLHVCLVCTGMGHVRRATSRQVVAVPDGPTATLARTQRLPGEPQQQQQVATEHAGHHHHRHGSGLLRKAIQLGEQLSKVAGQQQQQQGGKAAALPTSSGSAEASSSNGNGNAGAAPQQQQQQPVQQQNNIVNAVGLGASKKQNAPVAKA